MSPSPARGTAVLFSDVLNGMDRLLRGEVALAKAEVRQNVRAVRHAAVQLVLAVVFGAIALNMLAGSVLAGLVAAGLSPGVAAMLLGLVLLAIAYGCLQWGLGLLDPARLHPKHTFHDQGKDLASVRRFGARAMGQNATGPDQMGPNAIGPNGIGKRHANG